MVTGQIYIDFKFDYIQYTGEDQDKERFFEVFGEKTDWWLEDMIESGYITFNEDKSFKIEIIGEHEIYQNIVNTGDYIVFTPSNDFYFIENVSQFIVLDEEGFNKLVKGKSYTTRIK